MITDDAVTACRSCGSVYLEPVVNLGMQHLSDFRADEEKPPLAPLELLLCPRCRLVQLRDTTPRELLYHDNYGFYSGINEGIRHDLESVVHQALAYRPTAGTWLDIACNDGTLLSYVPPRVVRVGVDPVKKFADLAAPHADRIVSDYFDPEALRRADADTGLLDNKFDVITSVSMFYDVDDPGGFVDDVKSCLAERGVWIIQQNYLLAMVENNSIDNICHEHLTYWSLLALNQLMQGHGMRIIDVQTSSINGGSIRTVVVHDDAWYNVQPSVEKQLCAERSADLQFIERYRKFGRQGAAEIQRLREWLHTNDTSSVFLYGASTRGATLWQAAGITEQRCPYAVERNPAKVGLRYSAVGSLIIAEDTARDMQPDVMLVGPWWFRDQIIEREKRYLRRGGRLVFPLPHFEIVAS